MYSSLSQKLDAIDDTKNKVIELLETTSKAQLLCIAQDYLTLASILFVTSYLFKTSQWLSLYIHEVEGSNPNIPLFVALNLAQYPPRYGQKTIKSA